jgi:MarR family transcriptional regulator, organic hydroperoxide resistance regulator
MPPSVGAPPFDLEASLGYLVGVVSRRMTRELNQQLQPLGVTAPQFVVLAVLWQHDGLAQNVIADLIGSDRPTLTAMLKLMTAQGLVRRDRDAADNRYQRVYLTPEGRRLRETLPALAARVNEAAAADLGPEDLATLMSLLNRIRTTLGAARTPPSTSEPQPMRGGS